MRAYAGFETDRYIGRSRSSWVDPGWRALLVQEFEHVAGADELVLPPAADRHLWLITEGSGALHVDTGDGWQPAPIADGHVAMAVPGRPTRIRYAAARPMRSIHVHLPAETAERAEAELGTGARAPIAALDERDSVLFRAVLRSLALKARQGADELYAQSAAEFLAAHLATRAGSDASDPLKPTLSRVDARAREAIAFMRDRLGEPLRLADIADAVSLSSYHFLRVFKQATGTTPGRYLIRLRIEEAKRLLDRGLTVGEVARRCGFAGSAHLSAVFLRETGLRPSAYRDR